MIVNIRLNTTAKIVMYNLFNPHPDNFKLKDLTNLKTCTNKVLTLTLIFYPLLIIFTITIECVHLCRSFTTPIVKKEKKKKKAHSDDPAI